ncbi:hypothetical protein [Streptomyces parvulus]
MTPAGGGVPGDVDAHLHHQARRNEGDCVHIDDIAEGTPRAGRDAGP